jgi:hypothetical protein
MGKGGNNGEVEDHHIWKHLVRAYTFEWTAVRTPILVSVFALQLFIHFKI